MTSERRRAALVMVAIGLTLSIVSGYLLVDAWIDALSAWRRGAGQIRISGGDVGMLALLPILLGLTTWGAVAAFRDDAAVKRLGNIIAMASMIAVPIALGGSWLFLAWAERRLAAEGYVRCGGADRTGRFPALTMCSGAKARRP